MLIDQIFSFIIKTDEGDYYEQRYEFRSLSKYDEKLFTCSPINKFFLLCILFIIVNDKSSSASGGIVECQHVALIDIKEILSIDIGRYCLSALPYRPNISFLNCVPKIPDACFHVLVLHVKWQTFEMEEKHFILGPNFMIRHQLILCSSCKPYSHLIATVSGNQNKG